MIDTVITTGSNCMAPSAMLLTGMVFASKDLKSMVTNRKIYISCILKMVLVPMAGILILAALKVPEDMAVMILMMLVLPTGLNSVVLPEAYGGDSRSGAQFCFVSTSMCLFSIPLLFLLFEYIC